MKKMKKSYVGCKVVVSHKGSNDTEYQRIQGIVVSQRSVVGDDKGVVFVIQSELHDKENDEIVFAYHTVYFDKIHVFLPGEKVDRVGIMRVIRRDAVRDSLVKRSLV